MDIEFKNILEVDESLQMMVREWRNSADVKKYMYSDHDISVEEHIKWLDSLKNSEKNLAFVVFIDNNPIGIVSIVNINKTHKTSDWGFYIYDTSLRGKGIGTSVLEKLINYAFNSLNIDKLNCEAIITNIQVHKLYQKVGFKEEGIKRKNIIKNGERMDVIQYGLLKSEWNNSNTRTDNRINYGK